MTPPAGVVVRESSTEPQVSEGETTLEVSPDTAYKSVADYDAWRVIFRDISEVRITQRNGDDARVTFVKPDGNVDNLHFHNRSSERTIWFEDTGGTAVVWAEITFSPGPHAVSTTVHARLFADVHGLASVFVTDSKVREMRQQRIADELHDLQTYFSHR